MQGKIQLQRRDIIPHAWLRENSATERLIERAIESEKQIRAGEVMTAEEVDEVMAMDLQWLR